jgi:type III secretion protein T
MVLATLLSAPILAVLFVIDLGLGLVNRFAQQLNVFQLSLSIKSFVATGMILLMLTGFIQAVINDVLSRPAALRALLGALH